MQGDRSTRVKLHLQELAANFISEESNRMSLITVTSISLSPDLKRSTIFISVFPEEKEHAALDFLKRVRPQFRDYIKERVNMKSIPFFDFEIDRGEKSRQHIDELLSKENQEKNTENQ